MWNTIRLKDIYPVALFMMLLMTWSLVGASKINETISPLQWNASLEASDVKDVCKDNSLPLVLDSSCEKQSIDTVSPVFVRQDFDKLLSRVETKNYIQ